jgi:hypothetical protein
MIIHNRIAFSNKGTAFISMAGSGDPTIETASTPRPDDIISSAAWAYWGTDNLLPIQMTRDIEECGVLAAAIDGKARFGIGKGLRPMRIVEVKANGEEVLEPVYNPEIEEFMEESDIFNQMFGLFKDVIGFANYHVRFKFNNAGTKIGLLIRDDVTEFRYAKKDKATGLINNTYLSAVWDKAPSEKDKTLLKFDLLPSIGPSQYLTGLSDTQRARKEFSITGRVPGWNRHYYSMPTWWAAKKWVEIAKSVPSMKAAMFNNNIRLKYVVTIYDSYWIRAFGDEWNTLSQDEKDQKRTELYESIDNFLAGTENSYKSVYVPGFIDPVTGKSSQDIEIKPIEDTTKQGELLPDSAAANSEILFALMMNPALMGADTPGGPYSGGAGSGSNIREASLIQVMIQEFERHQCSKIMNIIKKVNGWPSDIVWRFPGLVLTTLDTGGSTAQIMGGN